MKQDQKCQQRTCWRGAIWKYSFELIWPRLLFGV